MESPACWKKVYLVYASAIKERLASRLRQPLDAFHKIHQ
jgi:hypothetical protein